MIQVYDINTAQLQEPGLCNFKILLKAFLASSVHLNFLAFFCKSYIGISHLRRLGRKDDKKLTIPQKALVCLRVFGDSKFLMASHLSFNGV